MDPDDKRLLFGWRPAFAWWPCWIDGRFVWLRRIERRTNYYSGEEEFRLPVNR